MLKKNVRLISLLLALCLMFSLCACNNKNPDPTPTTKNYTVQVLAPSGSGVEAVDVYVYEGEELVWYGKTNAEGKMTFSSKEDVKNWTAVLSNVPAGFEVAESYPITGLETTITLAAGEMKEDDLDTLRYKLGDIVKDFSITDSEDNTLKLSELLKTKKAIVLNFWYENCVPCKMEFPYLQQAYENYADKIEVLAMNATDSADAVKAFRTANGYTFPMAAVDPRWEDVMQLTSFPTTVVIDRFGNIALIHKGSIDNVQDFNDIFDFFTADDYEQQLMESLEDIRKALAEPGSAASPLEFGGVTEFKVTVPAGKVIYCDLYKVSDMILTVENSNVYVIYNDQTYGSVNGVLSMKVNSPDAFTPAKLQFGNIGKTELTYQVKLTPIPGTIGAPHPLTVGQFETKLEKGNEKGVYYTYVAAENGTFTVQCDSVTKGVTYDYTLYNLNTYENVTMSSTESTSVSVKVNAGDPVQLIIGTVADADDNPYPAADFVSTASFVKDEQPSDPDQPDNPDQPDDPDQPDNPDNPDNPGTTTNVNYMIAVMNLLDKPVAGITVNLTGTAGSGSAVTNANGIATISLPAGTYDVTLTVPAGYEDVSIPTQVTKQSKRATMFVSQATPDGYEALSVGNAFILSTGSQNVTLQPGELTYFVFSPTVSGQYQITTSTGKLGYYGNNTQYIVNDLIANEVHTNTSVTLNIKDGHIGSTYVFSVSGNASSGTMTITRIGNAILDITDQPWVTYTGTTTPTSNFTKPAGTLTYVDITASTSAYTLEKRADGYYINGKLAYVNIGSSAPYISLAAPAQQSTGVKAYVEQPDGSVIKEDYTNLVLAWADCADTTGVVPLNDDLIHIYKEFGADQSWWVNGHLINEIPNLNPEIAWMFAICYVA